MTIAIGVPVRDIKGYSIGRWLKAISLLEWSEPIQIIAVDNTDDTKQEEFVKFFESKVIESGLDQKLRPVELLAVKDVFGLESEARLAKSREVFRKRLLALGVDVWFSLECDIIPPPETLKMLVPFLDTVDMVNHTYPDRDVKHRLVGGIGCSLLKMSFLKEFSFTSGNGFGQGIDPLEPNCFYSSDGWMAVNILRSGLKVATFDNLLSLQHLNEAE